MENPMENPRENPKENPWEHPGENPKENPRGNPRENPKSSTWTATTHPSIKEAALRAASTKGGGRLRRPPPFVDSFMDGFVEAKEAAGAAQTHVNLGKTCTCMHILRATSDPQGHHGRAQRPGEQGFSNVFTNTKKTRSVRTIILPAVSRRDLCYASENE